MSGKISVVIENDDHGYFAHCPDLPGCHSQGDTFEEVMKSIREAVELYLETLDEEERKTCLSRDVINVSLEASV